MSPQWGSYLTEARSPTPIRHGWQKDQPTHYSCIGTGTNIYYCHTLWRTIIGFNLHKPSSPVPLPVTNSHLPTSTPSNYFFSSTTTVCHSPPFLLGMGPRGPYVLFLDSDWMDPSNYITPPYNRPKFRTKTGTKILDEPSTYFTHVIIIGRSPLINHQEKKELFSYLYCFIHSIEPFSQTLLWRVTKLL